MRDRIIRFLQRVANVVLPLESRQNSQLSQRSLYFHYRELLLQGWELPSFRDTGFRVYSQSDEDGLLLYLFSLIGFKNRLIVDIAAGAPIGGNATNLIVNWGCNALLVEGSSKLLEETASFYRRNPDTQLFPPKARQAWVTVENQ